MSIKFKLVAVAGPLLVTEIRYERLIPTCAGFGDAVLLTDRSMLDGLMTFSITGARCIVEPAWPLTFTV